MTAQELYRTDFFEWTQRNAELLSRGCLDQADIAHIAEELADLGINNERAVQSFLTRLIVHLLKWQMQPTKRSPSWRRSVADSRTQLKRIFTRSPSLRLFARKTIPEVYQDALWQASNQTELPRNAFPSECPYTFDQLMDIDFIPS